MAFFPKLFWLTLDVVRAVSAWFCPVPARSLCHRSIPLNPFTVTVTDADFVESATLVALIDGDAEGTLPGAVNIPVEEIVPTLALPPATPLTFHVTPVLVVLETVALNCKVCPMVTLPVDGVTATVILLAGGG